MEHLLDDRGLVLYGHNIIPCRWLGYVHKNTKGVRESDAARGSRWPKKWSKPFLRKPKATPPIESRTYAESQGWTAQESAQLENPNLDALSDRAALARLQSLLFFGVLERVFDTLLPFNDYVFHTPDGMLLRTTALRPVIRNLETEINGLSVEKDDSRPLRAIRKEYSVLCQWYAFFDDAANNSIANAPEIAILCRQALLTMNIFTNLNVLTRRLGFRMHLESPHRQTLTNSFYAERLLESNFCLSHFRKLQTWRVDALEYSCVLEHHDSNRVKRHKICTRSECIVNNVSTSSFQPSHLASDCQCNWIKIPVPSIRKSLENGNYFALNVHTLMDARNDLSRAVVPYSEALEYTAISHVWSHGAGSDADDGLPRCRLQSIIHKIPDNLRHAIWLDSLCIPRDKSLKMKSISMMDKIYRNAAAVVAIDEDLMSLSCQNSTSEALGLRFLLCDWNQRLWTFQEASLAKDLYIAFKDQTMLAKDLWKALRNNRSSGVPHRLADEIARLVPGKSETLMFKLVMLGGRSSSVRRDEALVIATIAGLDMDAIARDYHDVSLQDDEILKHLWLMIGRVHHSVLFSGAKKLQYPGFRYAPRSFMDRRIGTYFDYHLVENATISESGICAKYLVVLLRSKMLCFTVTINMPSMRLHLYFWGKNRLAAFDTVVLARIPRGTFDTFKAVGLCREANCAEDGTRPCFSYSGGFRATAINREDDSRALYFIEAPDPVEMEIVVG